MRLRGINAGDEVVCEVRGARFTARVRDRDDRGLTVDVIEGRQLPRGWLSERVRVTARQVVARAGRSRVGAR
jgi:hypothetical protein